MRIIFMGTPDFAVPALLALLQSGHEVIAVYSQPPKPKGRGYGVSPSRVHQVALEHNIQVFHPKSLKPESEQEIFKDLNPDIAVVAAYGLILPQAILDIPKLGCLNIHGSILPRWRGAAPIQRAIMEQDDESGVCIMQMEAGLDTGPVFEERRVSITSKTTSAMLHDELASLGAQALLSVIEALDKDPRIQPKPQPEEGVTYAHKLTHEDAKINWELDAAKIDCLVRGLNPWPGSYVFLNDLRLKIIEAMPITMDHRSKPGTVLDSQLTIACGRGAIRILKLQKEGGKPLSAKDFLNGLTIHPGAKLTSYGPV
jgi:methionyl-tRNA formyltransferase